MAVEKRKTVLIVDDEVNVCSVLVKLFQTKGGFLAEYKTDITSAMQRIKENDLDLLVLDLNMKDANGLSLAIALRDDDYKIPIIIYSGDIDDATAATVGQMENTWLLHKPADQNRLVQIARSAVAQTSHETQISYLLQVQKELSKDQKGLKEVQDKMVLAQDKMMESLLRIENNMVKHEDIEGIAEDVVVDKVMECKATCLPTEKERKAEIQEAIKPIIKKELGTEVVAAMEPVIELKIASLSLRHFLALMRKHWFVSGVIVFLVSLFSGVVLYLSNEARVDAAITKGAIEQQNGSIKSLATQVGLIQRKLLSSPKTVSP
jgi:DNA-binding response OmpR family regulator